MVGRGDILVFGPQPQMRERAADTADLTGHNFGQVGPEHAHLDGGGAGVDNQDHAAAMIAPSAMEDRRAAAGSAREVSRIGTLAPITIPPAQPPAR